MKADDLSSNSLEGDPPSYIGFIFPYSMSLNVPGNSLQGGIPSSMCQTGQLQILDVFSNRFVGELPEQLMRCQSLSYLQLSNNSLRGQVLQMAANLSRLMYLYLSNNQFSGEMSPWLLNSHPFLTFLDVSNNSLSGSIPDWVGNFQGLDYLILASNNSFKLSYTRTFAFGKKQPHGSIATMFGTTSCQVVFLLGLGFLSNLRALLLAGNSFEGLIPQELCQANSISINDLSHNHLSGRIPSCFSKLAFGNSRIPEGTFTHSSLATHCHKFYGEKTPIKVHLTVLQEVGVPPEVHFTSKHRLESYKGHIWYHMSGLDLSCNNLSGSIPFQLCNLSNIHSLNVSYNLLVGEIPVSFSNLYQIECLDFSHNSLSCKIPPQLIKTAVPIVIQCGPQQLVQHDTGAEKSICDFRKSELRR
ncbi:LOW QUALITY PROTEIN: receptor-like protein 1 [Punica granatum]|uniref:LOW QUALITY PROTEIN: receptor-like protein 1 n=1 Tax=Punica granatum TaxID=22663 RepID=A0A6P8CVU7_PUNGR|nr:LOW QUALITY PROTEIN: receptor-like protein 1 [Punica granatum]